MRDALMWRDAGKTCVERGEEGWGDRGDEQSDEQAANEQGGHEDDEVA